MRTKAEIEKEALQLQQAALTLAPVPTAEASGAMPTPLFVFPETAFKANAASEFEGPLTYKFSRFISLTTSGGESEFRLFEREVVTSASGQIVRDSQPSDIVSSESAYDVLAAGYQCVDEDRLTERIEPLVDRLETVAFPDAPAAEDVAEIENLAKDFSLSASARMRFRVDAVAVLEGRMEAGEFIARTVGRQECFEPSQTFRIAHQITESIEI